MQKKKVQSNLSSLRDVPVRPLFPCPPLYLQKSAHNLFRRVSAGSCPSLSLNTPVLQHLSRALVRRALLSVPRSLRRHGASQSVICAELGGGGGGGDHPGRHIVPAGNPPREWMPHSLAFGGRCKHVQGPKTNPAHAQKVAATFPYSFPRGFAGSVSFQTHHKWLMFFLFFFFKVEARTCAVI